MKIKKCPFCGSDGILNTYSSIYETVYSISCDGEKDSNCAGINGTDFRDSEDEVIEAWNKRIKLPNRQ